MSKLLDNPMDQPVREKIMPVPHMMLRLIRANNTFFIANRGGFKTTMGIALYIIDCVQELPRSTGIIVGPSYEHLGDNTLNPLFNALNQDGFEPGVHYVACTKPPDDWQLPLTRVDSAKKYDHLISFWNGTNYGLISMAKVGPANGYSAQHGVFDEVKLMDQQKLTDIIFPVFRGHEKAVIDDENHPRFGKMFKDSPLYMSKFFTTDKLADPAKIQWILDKRKLNNPDKLDLILNLQLALNDLMESYNHAGINKKAKLKVDINAVEVRLSNLRRNTTLYIESNHIHTQQILGKGWYDDKVTSMKPYELKVAIENEDPTRPEDGFYPQFDTLKHVHSMNDYDPSKPLIIACDYQHSVSPIPIAQKSKLPGATMESLNYIDEVYTMAPQGLDDAVGKVCGLYSGHFNKKVYYIYDHTAKGKRPDAEKYNDIVLKAFRRYGWQVIEVYTHAAPHHYEKYMDVNGWLQEKDPTVPAIRVNSKCERMILSITSAPAKVSNGKTEKDKKFENTTKYPGLDQSTTTHFSDAFDMINHGVIKLKRIHYLSMGGGALGFR